MSTDVRDFLRLFQSEVRDRAMGAENSAPDFAVNAFTEYVIELLSSEVGITEGAEAVYFQGEVGRGEERSAVGGQIRHARLPRRAVGAKGARRIEGTDPPARRRVHGV